MAFRRPIKQPFESTMAFSKFFTILPKTGGTLKTFFTIRFFVNMSPLVYFSECSSSAVSIGLPQPRPNGKSGELLLSYY